MMFTLPSLGDRHGENILFEEGTGGVLHVDFNCLFDKVSHELLMLYIDRLTNTGVDIRHTGAGPLPSNAEHGRCFWSLRI